MLIAINFLMLFLALAFIIYRHQTYRPGVTRQLTYRRSLDFLLLLPAGLMCVAGIAALFLPAYREQLRAAVESVTLLALVPNLIYYGLCCHFKVDKTKASTVKEEAGKFAA